jgi:hypothetical protein
MKRLRENSNALFFLIALNDFSHPGNPRQGERRVKELVSVNARDELARQKQLFP